MSSRTFAEPSGSRVPWDDPEVEVLRGIELPKVSPRRTHGILQGAFFELLHAWGSDRGDVGTEWRFHIPNRSGGEDTLIPDVAFVAAEVLDALSDDEVEEPHVAPTIAVEIRSPGDRPRNISVKALSYIEAGTRLVVDVDPAAREIVAHGADGSMRFIDGTAFAHPLAPGLRFDVSEFFDRAKRKRPQRPV